MTRARLTTDVADAAAAIRAGGLVAFPTETVYGLGADAANPDAVRRLFAVKRRPADHPLIVHLADAGAIDAWASYVPDAARRLATRFWPGPLTLILNRAPHVLDIVTGGQDTVGLRVPGHPMARAFLAAAGTGVAAPSANRFGRVSATTAAHVLDEIGDEIDLVLDGGAADVGLESTIVSCAGARPALLRPGAITPAMLADVLGARPATGAEGVRAPGSHAAHYAPRTPMQLVPGAALWQEAHARAAAGRRVVVISRSPPRPGASGLNAIRLPDDPAGYAHDLYDALRRADRLGGDVLVVEAPPDGEAWLAIRDRLARAAAGSGPDAP